MGKKNHHGISVVTSEIQVDEKHCRVTTKELIAIAKYVLFLER